MILRNDSERSKRGQPTPMADPPAQQRESLRISIEEYCEFCDHPDACACRQIKYVILKKTDCLDCLAADYGKISAMQLLWTILK